MEAVELALDGSKLLAEEELLLLFGEGFVDRLSYTLRHL